MTVAHPSISLCMIVKNEAAWLAGAVESARSLVSETVILDTGSTDDTVDVARGLGAQVHHVAWPEDFATARNLSLTYATGDWILVLDADERLDPAGCAALQRWIAQPTAPSAMLIQTTYSYATQLITWKPNRLSNAEYAQYPGYIESPLIRLWRRDTGARFSGLIHEEVVGVAGPLDTVTLDVRIHHLGRMRTDNGAAKRALYLRLTKEKSRRAPQDAKAAYEYAVSCWEEGEIHNAIDAFRTAVRLFPTHVPSLTALAYLEMRHGSRDAATGYFDRALKVNPRYIGALQGWAELLIGQQRFVQAGALLEQAHLIDPEHPQVLKMLGVLYCHNGQSHLGLSFLRKAAKRNPHDAEILFWMGKLMPQGLEAV